MEYNTSRKKLVLPEYGRNIQRMVDYAKTIEDRTRRTQFAYLIVSVMGSMNPTLRDVADSKHKLWDHLAIIANFDLDIDSPYPPPSIETLNAPPSRVPYQHNNITYKYYGRTIEKLIRKAADMQPGKERDALIKLTANQMKRSYVLWNKENVADEIIFEHINELSDQKLTPQPFALINTRELVPRAPRKKRSPNKK